MATVMLFVGLFLVTVGQIEWACCAATRQDGMALPTPINLYVSDVTSTSAVLHWSLYGDSRARTGIIDCEVYCAGLRLYMKASGDRSRDTHTATRYAPEGQNHVLLGHLQPNFNYSCFVTTEGRAGEWASSAPNFFSTDYTDPEAPQTPHVTMVEQDPAVIEIDVFPTSTKHGPISGYEVQFHVVTGETDKDLAGVPLIPAPLLKPQGPLATLSKAQESSHPLSFRIPYAPFEIPKKITVSENRLNDALKSKVYYSVVTVAYSSTRRAKLDNLDSRIFLYSSSAPTPPFLPSGEPIPKRETMRDHPIHAAAIIIFSVVIPLVVFTYIASLLMAIACLEYRIRLKYPLKSVGPSSRKKVFTTSAKRPRRKLLQVSTHRRRKVHSMDEVAITMDNTALELNHYQEGNISATADTLFNTFNPEQV